MARLVDCRPDVLKVLQPVARGRDRARVQCAAFALQRRSDGVFDRGTAAPVGLGEHPSKPRCDEGQIGLAQFLISVNVEFVSFLIEAWPGAVHVVAGCWATAGRCHPPQQFPPQLEKGYPWLSRTTRPRASASISLLAASNGTRIASAAASGPKRPMRSLALLPQKDTPVEFSWRGRSGVPARSSIMGNRLRRNSCTSLSSVRPTSLGRVCASSTAMRSGRLRTLLASAFLTSPIAKSRNLIPMPSAGPPLSHRSQPGRGDSSRASHSSDLISAP